VRQERLRTRGRHPDADVLLDRSKHVGRAGRSCRRKLSGLCVTPPARRRWRDRGNCPRSRHQSRFAWLAYQHARNFSRESIAPGLYTLRVTLAGFLPTIQQHVRISAHVTTVVRVELESMFASLDQLRRQPSTASVESDDWKWVLRSASITRPVLQWRMMVPRPPRTLL